MTEAEWLACTDLPNYMMGCLGDRPSERQFRLFACAMVRQVWHLLTDPRSRADVELAEQFADGLVSRQQLDEARIAAEEASELLDRSSFMGGFSPGAPTAASRTGVVENFDNVVFEIYSAVNCSRDHRPRKERSREQTDLLRDIFRNPFRPLPYCNPSWLTWNDGAVRRMAEEAYAERSSTSGTLDNARLGVLADALEDAGCTDGEILSHLRSRLDHVRGCWVIDLLLGKEDHSMTEQRWDKSTDLGGMFRFLWNHRELSRRKQLLFGVACCRRIWHRLTDEEMRSLVELAESCADGVAAEADLEDALGAADSAFDAEIAPHAAFYAAGCRPVKCATFAAIPGEYLDGSEGGPDSAEQAAQCNLLRCIIGNPFRPSPLEEAFLTPSVAETAQTLYRQRAFDRLAVLADALEVAGCDNSDILRHCREPGEHARGCWVVDLILGKQ